MNETLSVEEIKEQIEEIKNSLPAHSIPAAMLIELEDLEEQLEQLQNGYTGENNAAA